MISGIGAVYAASATTAALLSGPYAAVLSCGCSGAHVVGQKMGDLVLGAQVRPLDPVVVARDGAVQYSGVRYSMTTKGTTSWAADGRLLELAKGAAEAVRQSHAPGMRVDVGTVGSGDAWRQSPGVIHEVHSRAQTLCEEMEAHAVAQVCAASTSLARASPPHTASPSTLAAGVPPVRRALPRHQGHCQLRARSRGHPARANPSHRARRGEGRPPRSPRHRRDAPPDRRRPRGQSGLVEDDKEAARANSEP